MSKCGSMDLLLWEQWEKAFFNEKHRKPKSDKELLDFIRRKRRRKGDSN